MFWALIHYPSVKHLVCWSKWTRMVCTLQWLFVQCRCLQRSIWVSSPERENKMNFTLHLVFYGCSFSKYSSNWIRHNLFTKIKHSLATFTLVECTLCCQMIKRMKCSDCFQCNTNELIVSQKGISYHNDDWPKMWNKLRFFLCVAVV